jgi:EAL domain-containing protein (putative c-di-GMP-specific phosphodiesterase class I)/DNA-binding response OmpR family regulator
MPPPSPLAFPAQVYRRSHARGELIILPLAPIASARVHKLRLSLSRAGESMPEERLRILVIDDDVDLTASVAAVLQANGYDVVTATGGEQGLELAFTRHPHLVLLDVTMPGMDGHQVCRELQFGYTKDIPVVFLSARTELSHMMEANRSGASAYITKPFRSEHLLQTIRDVLRDASVYRDDVTGLPTLANVQVDVQRMLFDHGQLGIIYVSLSGVQTLEQLQGFEVVDDVYRAVGQALQQARGELLRGDDFISISSLGDAFLIVLSPSRESSFITEDDLLVVKQRLEQKLLAQLERDLESRLLQKVDLFVGCSRLTQSPKIRFKRALLDAITRATQSIEAERDEIRARLRDQFEEVMAGRQLSCVFHPIVNLSDFEAIGFEILSRGPRESDLHRPDALFEIARSEGRVAELDRLCRRTACEAGQGLPRHALRFINTEPLTMFLHSHGDSFVQEFVDVTDSSVRGLTVIEITENSVIDDFDRMRDMVRQLRAHGFRVAIDDAGAGYAGLQTMVEIEPDFIKLDMSLIRGVDTSVVKQRLVRTLRDFCREAAITLIAEGIETARQLETLRELGVTHGQGFLFGLPGTEQPKQASYPPLETVKPK